MSAGKTAFPQSWSRGQIMHAISDLATDPVAWANAAQQGSRTVLVGTRGGVEIRVIVGGNGDSLLAIRLACQGTRNGRRLLVLRGCAGGVRALLIMVADQLPRTTVALATEIVDANESGIALETISEMLVESDGRLSAEAFGTGSDLVVTMGLDHDVVDRLRPRVTGNERGTW